MKHFHEDTKGITVLPDNEFHIEHGFDTDDDLSFEFDGPLYILGDVTANSISSIGPLCVCGKIHARTKLSSTTDIISDTSIECDGTICAMHDLKAPVITAGGSIWVNGVLTCNSLQFGGYIRGFRLANVSKSAATTLLENSGIPDDRLKKLLFVRSNPNDARLFDLGIESKSVESNRVGRPRTRPAKAGEVYAFSCRCCGREVHYPPSTGVLNFGESRFGLCGRCGFRFYDAVPRYLPDGLIIQDDGNRATVRRNGREREYYYAFEETSDGEYKRIGLLGL